MTGLKPGSRPADPPEIALPAPDSMRRTYVVIALLAPLTLAPLRAPVRLAFAHERPASVSSELVERARDGDLEAPPAARDPSRFGFPMALSLLSMSIAILTLVVGRHRSLNEHADCPPQRTVPSRGSSGKYL